jgi:DNA-binding response OmpR family regulator
MMTGLPAEAETKRLDRARLAMRRWTLRTSPPVLIVGTPEHVPDDLIDELAVYGRRAEIVRDGAVGLIEVGRLDPGAVVIGLELGNVRCEDWVRAVRQASVVPIFLLLGENSVDDATAVIRAGASGIISGRCTGVSIARRLAETWDGRYSQYGSAPHLVVGPLEIDVPAFTLQMNGERVKVPLKEFELLTCLMLNADRVVTFAEMGEWLWGSDPERPSRRAIHSHVQKLRINLGDPSIVKTVWGQGYTISHLSAEFDGGPES